MSSSENLRPFFEPTGVVIVGARRTPGFGYGIPAFLQKRGFGDRMHLVSPSGGELHGMPVHQSLKQVPGPVDLAIVIVPAAAVPGVIPDIASRGRKHVIIESAGFAETGEEGRELQEQARIEAENHGMRIIGPNCVGVINNSSGFCSAEVIEEALTPGPVAIIAQSGVFGNVLLDNLYQRGIFISKAVTLGNRMDVNECEILDYMEADPATEIIMMYLEGAAKGRLLRETLQRVTQKKPVLILKSGRTGAGRSATASHTGSLSGEDELYQGMFEQAGAVRAQTLEELIEMTRVFSTQPRPGGNRLGIVTSSGSLGALATDVAVDHGLVLPPLSSQTVEAVRQAAPRWMNVKNPLDVGPSGQYEKALTAMMQDPGIDMVLAITIIPFVIFRQFGPIGFTAKAWFGDIKEIRKRAPQKPLVVCAVGNTEFIKHMTELTGPEVPVLSSPELAARALSALWKYLNGIQMYQALK
jgi:acyl-CoA synthetase (NDP forming)